MRSRPPIALRAGGLSRLLRLLPLAAERVQPHATRQLICAPLGAPLLTALGIGAAVATLVAILGLMDSFVGTVDRNDAEVLGDHPDRVDVGLDSIVLDSGPEVAAVREADSVGELSPVLQMGVGVSVVGGEGFDVLLEALDLESAVWAPTGQR